MSKASFTLSTLHVLICLYIVQLYIKFKEYEVFSGFLEYIGVDQGYTRTQVSTATRR